MARFIYEGRTADGKTITGDIEAKNQPAAAREIQNQGYRIVSIKQKKEKKGLTILPERIGITEKIFFTQNLYIMVKTGFSIAQAMKTLALQTTNKRFKKIIETLREDLEKGITLSKSLQKFPKVFSGLFTNMIAAGEISGKLEEVLQQLTLQMKKDHSLTSKIKSALTYPIIILGAMLLVGTAMMVFVIPQMTAIFISAGAKLPLPTRILISISDFLIHKGIFVAVGVAALVYGYIRFLRTQRGKKVIHKIVLGFPIIGSIVKKVNITRFTRNLSSLLKTDIPIVQTFLIIEKTLGNYYYRQVMHEASEQVKEGVTIAAILEKYPELFPPILVQMISVGEQSGTLEYITEEVAVFYEEEVDQTMTSLPTILEPVIILLIGVAAAALVAAIILPIYSLSEAI